MFTHTKKLQYNAKPEKPNPVMARRLQEILGGQWGEMSVMNMYLFQGWNARGNEKIKDLILDTATEEIGHVEMIATMIARLLEGASISAEAEAVKDPAVAAVMGGMDPNHAIYSGLGAMPRDANGVPWTSQYIVSSGNLLADLRMNVTAESQGRLQVSRLYNMTEDKGIRDMLSFLLARDTQHQLQWLQAIKELEEKEGIVVPANTGKIEHDEFNNVLYNFSEGEDSTKVVADGVNAPDGRPFRYEEKPVAMGDTPALKPTRPEIHNSKPLDPPEPMDK